MIYYNFLLKISPKKFEQSCRLTRQPTRRVRVSCIWPV